MSGTHTRPVRVEAVLVPDERVAAVLDRRTWLAEDTAMSASVSPGAFGVVRGAVADLALHAERRSDPRAAELAEALTREARALRAAAYAAADEPATDDVIARRLELRAQALDLAGRATSAAVVAAAGAAMRAGHPAGRRAREALFLLVQAQTSASRAASLTALLSRSG
jgi:hypothetical protein